MLDYFIYVFPPFSGRFLCFSFCYLGALSQYAFTCSQSTKETTGKICEICLNIAIKTQEQRQFIVNFKQISHIVQVFPLLILSK